jgi:Ca2+-binding EF-hand superfamily protein
MISDRVHGIISAEEWSDIIAYLYNAADSKQLGAILQQRATGTRGISNSNPGATIDDDRGSSTSGTTTRPRSASAGHAARQAAMHTSSSSSQRSGTAVASKAAGASMDRATELRRFGYTRTPAKTRSSSPSPTDSRRVVLAFQDFLRCVLDFQLRNHEAFLGRFVRIFRLADANSDGFVTTDEFYNMYTQLRMDGRDESQLNASELDDLNDDFNAILSIVDPHSSNRITFSFAAANLSRIGARLPAAPSSN